MSRGLVICLGAAVGFALLTCDGGGPSGSQPAPVIDSLSFVEHTVSDSMFCYAMLATDEWVFRNEDTLYVIVTEVDQGGCPPFRMWHEVTGDTVSVLYELSSGGACADTVVPRYLEYAFRVTDIGSLYVRVNRRDTLIVIGEIVNENPCDLRRLGMYGDELERLRAAVLTSVDESCGDADECRYHAVSEGNFCDFRVTYSASSTDSAALVGLMDEYSKASHAYYNELRNYRPIGICDIMPPPDSLACDSARCKAVYVP